MFIISNKCMCMASRVDRGARAAYFWDRAHNHTLKRHSKFEAAQYLLNLYTSGCRFRDRAHKYVIRWCALLVLWAQKSVRENIYVAKASIVQSERIVGGEVFFFVCVHRTEICSRAGGA